MENCSNAQHYDAGTARAKRPVYRSGELLTGRSKHRTGQWLAYCRHGRMHHGNGAGKTLTAREAP